MNIQILINGIEYKAASHYSIRQQTGAISASDVDVLVRPDQDAPKSKQSVQILKDGVPFFFGFISNTETPEFSSGYEVQRHRLEIDSGEKVLQNRLVNEAYTNIYTHQIVQNLFDNYIAQENIQLGAISETTRLWEKYNAAYYNLYDALVELADDVGALFYISPDKKFYFQLKRDLVYIDMPAHVRGLKKTENADSLITEQTISGATEETTEQTEQFLWETNENAYQSSVQLNYPVSSVTACFIGEEISTGMSWRQVGFGVKSVDDEDTTKTFLYTEGSNTVALNPGAVTKPTSAVPYIKIVYIGKYDIIVTNSNPGLEATLARLSGTSGKIEKYTQDSTIETFADADVAASNTLAEAQEWTDEITAKCQQLESTDMYLAWKIADARARINGIYVIVERTIEDFGADSFLISVKLKNRSFYSRYGTCLKDTSKVKRSDVLVYKTNVFSERLTFNDGIALETAKQPVYPTATTGAMDGGLSEGLGATAYTGFFAPDIDITETDCGTYRSIAWGYKDDV
mgnify:CR=1 FL=1